MLLFEDYRKDFDFTLDTFHNRLSMNEKQENPIANLILNIAVPSIVLIAFSKEKYLGPVYGLMVAFIFPISYGTFGLIKARKVNTLSVVGLIGIALTGTFGLLKLDAKWIALKEAGIPFLLGLFVLISTKTPFPVVKKLIVNKRVLNMKKVNAALQERDTMVEFEQKIAIYTALLSSAFFLSSALNFILAKIMLVSEPGTSAFTEELGKMTAYSFPVIALPSLAIMLFIFYLIMRSITRLTGLRYDEIFAKR